MMVNNFPLHAIYLKDIISTFDQQKIYNDPLPEKVNDVYDIQKFVNVNDVWNDAKGILHNNHFYAIGIVGTQGTGKSTLAEQFAQKALDNDYKLIYALPEDYLTNVNSWLEKVSKDPRARNCLVLDDLSYSFDTQSKKQQALMKNVVSRFRHIFEGEVFVIYITHRLHATPPMLRNAGTWIFTQLSTIDRDDMREIIGKSKEQRETLEAMQSFLTNAVTAGNKNSDVTYAINEKIYHFKWGNASDKGDGRLMAALHNNELQIFNAVADSDLDFTQYQYPTDDSILVPSVHNQSAI